MPAGAFGGVARAPGRRAAARVNDVDIEAADDRGEPVDIGADDEGFFDASGSVTCVAPMRSSSRTIGPPAEATIAFQPAATSAAATSIVPRSTPPATRRGNTCKTVALLFPAGFATVLVSASVMGL